MTHRSGPCSAPASLGRLRAACAPLGGVAGPSLHRLPCAASFAPWLFFRASACGARLGVGSSRLPSLAALAFLSGRVAVAVRLAPLPRLGFRPGLRLGPLAWLLSARFVRRASMPGAMRAPLAVRGRIARRPWRAGKRSWPGIFQEYFLTSKRLDFRGGTRPDTGHEKADEGANRLEKVEIPPDFCYPFAS